MPTSPRLLVTRPLQQQRDFMQRASALGFECVSLPCIEIRPLPVELDFLAHFRGWLLFTSANAVKTFAAALDQAGIAWPDLPVHGIGPATASALTDAGQTVHHSPVPPFTSEAWLASIDQLDLPATALVIKGEGGRDQLIPGLQARGVEAHPLDVYRRQLPLIDDATRFDTFVTRAPDIISVTSDAVLHNLLALAGPHEVARLLTLPLVVNSPRCAHLATQLGFERPALIASPPGNDGQLRCLQHWLEEHCPQESASDQLIEP